MTTSPMQLIHFARYTLRRAEDAESVTPHVVQGLIADLTAVYLRTRNDRIANLLKVEIDLLEMLIP
jgi:hypothetical protein